MNRIFGNVVNQTKGYLISLTIPTYGQKKEKFSIQAGERKEYDEIFKFFIRTSL